MIWFLALHISALLFWCAALLYLPAMVVSGLAQRSNITDSPGPQDSAPRFVFTHVATPAALTAIISGTFVFVIGDIVDLWLVIKLTLVSGLVVCHAFMGLLVLRLEDKSDKPLRSWCALLAFTVCAFMTAIVWVVLAKPMQGNVL